MLIKIKDRVKEILCNKLDVYKRQDEQRMRKLIKDFLVAKGFSILEAENGEKALEVFEENKNKINLIPVSYTHLNQEKIYKILFKATSETLQELAKDEKYLGGEIGFFSILHPALIPGSEAFAQFGDTYIRLVTVSVGIMSIVAQCFDGFP